eukprot:366221-Chlamydomonas_euryale.AAC.8
MLVVLHYQHVAWYAAAQQHHRAAPWSAATQRKQDCVGSPRGTPAAALPSFGDCCFAPHNQYTPAPPTTTIQYTPAVSPQLLLRTSSTHQPPTPSSTHQPPPAASPPPPPA